jgi:hypothetical protein
MGALKDCETVLDTFFGQPVNSLTTGAFLLGGAVIWARSRQLILAVAVIATGIGSFLFHGPMPALSRLAHDTTLWLLVTVVTVKIVIDFRATGAWRHLVGPVALVAIVAVIGRLGATGGPLCHPDSIWQPHGLWHIGAATAVTWWGLHRPRSRAETLDRSQRKRPRGSLDRSRSPLGVLLSLTRKAGPGMSHIPEKPCGLSFPD